MNLSTLKVSLPVLAELKIPVFLWGTQGIGKTSVTLKTAMEMGYSLVHLHLATQEVGDLIGLLKHNPDGTVSHSRPDWFPTSPKCIIFLDELNQCKNPEVLSAMHPFILSGKLHQHTLPEECYVLGAGNYETTDFDVASITENTSLMSRFCHLDIVPTVSEWLSYAKENEVDNSIVSFIGNHNDMLIAPHTEFNLDFVKFEPRTYADFLNPIVKARHRLPETAFAEIVIGLIGTVAGTKFLSHMEVQDKIITADKVFSNYRFHKKEIVEMSNGDTIRSDKLNYLTDDILQSLQDPTRHLPATAFDNLVEFLKDVPREVAFKACEFICTKLPTAVLVSPERSNLLHEKLFNNSEILKIIEALHTGKDIES